MATVGGQSIVIIITGLNVSTQYQVDLKTCQCKISLIARQVACVAEADGGLMSTQQQIDTTRRSLNTSWTEVTISGMGITREESQADPAFHIMRASPMAAHGSPWHGPGIQATQFGYLFCQVFLSENIQLLGVPDVQTLEEIAPRGKRLGMKLDSKGGSPGSQTYSRMW